MAFLATVTAQAHKTHPAVTTSQQGAVLNVNSEQDLYGRSQKLTSGDVIEFATLPAGYKLADMEVWGDASLEASGTGALAGGIVLGNYTAAGTITVIATLHTFATTILNGAAFCVRAGSVTATLLTALKRHAVQTTDKKILFVCTATATTATASSKKIGVSLWYRPADPYTE